MCIQFISTTDYDNIFSLHIYMSLHRGEAERAGVLSYLYLYSQHIAQALACKSSIMLSEIKEGTKFNC